MPATLTITLGAALAFALIAFARRADRAREMEWYAVGLAVAALVYVVQAATAGGVFRIGIEALGLAAFAGLALMGLRESPAYLAFGWAAHGVWDLVLHGGVADYVPAWYPTACIGFDLVLAAYILISARRASRAVRRRGRARSSSLP